MTYKNYEVTRSVKLNKYPKYDAYILDRASYTKQNHWTMKDRSLRPTKNEFIDSVRLNKYSKYDAFL